MVNAAPLSDMGYRWNFLNRDTCQRPIIANVAQSRISASGTRLVREHEGQEAGQGYCLPCRTGPSDEKPLNPKRRQVVFALLFCRPTTRSTISGRVWRRDNHPTKRAAGMVKPAALYTTMKTLPSGSFKGAKVPGGS